VTLAGLSARTFGRIAREHALLLACACVTILLFNLPPHFNLALPGFVGNDSARDEAAIDSALQDAARAALPGREGTIIVMDARTGRIRAIVNPEAAYSQALMPGSAIKPFTTLAALRAGLIDEDSRTVCPGRFTGLSFSLPCVHADHLPPFNPSQAIAYSCNYYFATLGQRLGRDKLIATLREFDFGQTTGIGSKEAAGVLRPCEMGSSARIMRSAEANHAGEQADCNARSAVGESENLQVTPIQLLTAYAALLNGGHLYEPRIAAASDFRAVERSRVDISEQQRSIIAEGMAGAVRYGTARSAKLASLPLTIIGKTGTANPPQSFRSNGWFVGLAAPFESAREPESSEIELAVLVLLPRAHGSQAAELARQLFAAYANASQKPDRQGGQGSQPASSDATSGATNQSAIRNPQSAIVKVHLVHDNMTQELPLDDYVLGVMRAEGTMETEPEALKALAIAIRTFALKNAGRHAKDGYDFCSTTHCQRFVSSPTVRQGSMGNTALPDGRASDTRLIAAVRATEGQVLIDDHNQVVDSYFGASCGGETANIGDLWGVTPPSYLRGVRDEYCESGPHANWTDTISRADLLRALQSDSRTDVGSHLDDIAVGKRDESGRAEFINVDGEHRKTVRGWDFKIIVGRVLGWNILKSSRFEVTRSGSGFVFRGSGFGHGLGLCQEGAHVMAARGASYQKILEKYFPGTKVAPRNGDLSLARPFKGGDILDESNIGIVLEPRAVATGSRSPAGFLKTLLDPVATARGSDTKSTPSFSKVLCLIRQVCYCPFKTGNVSDKNEDVALAADEVQSTLTRRNKWLADLFPSLKGRPEFTGRYTAVAPFTRFLTISSEHFRVTYPADVDRRDIDQVLKTLESTRGDYLRRASSATTINIPTLDIRLNDSTGDFTSRTGQPWWAAAATKGNRIELQPLRTLKQRGVLFTTLKHELAHAVIDAITRERGPRWLEEGFAIYLAGEGETFKQYGKRGLLLDDELEKRLQRPTSQQDMRGLYAQAYMSVANMVHEQGEASVWKKLAGN
jgi:SpoIID/LytB domain protein